MHIIPFQTQQLHFPASQIELSALSAQHPKLARAREALQALVRQRIMVHFVAHHGYFYFPPAEITSAEITSEHTATAQDVEMHL
jgi:hypothetical protein